MEQAVDAVDSARERRRVTHVQADQFDVAEGTHRRRLGCVGRLADRGPDLVSLLDQRPAEIVTEVPIGPRDERLHSFPPPE